jgi:hypothetical protein
MGGDSMRNTVRISWVVGLAFFFVASSLSLSLGAEKKPVRFKVVNTFQVDLPGIEKAQLIHFEMDPGAEVKNFKVVSEVLWVNEGEFSYKYRNGKLHKKHGSQIVLRKKGDSWWQDEGTVIDVSNKGNGVGVMRGVQFIRTEK